MTYSPGAVERAMTIHQALLHALHGRQTWLQVADVIGLSHRRRPEPRPCFGELLHLDGSRHRWLPLLPETWHTLLV